MAKSKTEVVSVKLGDHVRLSQALLQALDGYDTLLGNVIYVDTKGEHFWEHRNGVFANNKSLANATKIYLSKEEVIKHEGSLERKKDFPSETEEKELEIG